jgi:cell division protein FtsB
MAITTKSLKIGAGILTTLLLVSIAGNIYYWDKSRDLASEKDRVEQKANALLLGQSRDMDDLTEQVDRTQKKNQSLLEEVEELNRMLSQVNTDLWELRTRKTGNAADLNAMRYRDQARLLALNQQAGQLTDKNNSLTNQNDQLNQQLHTLRDSLQAISNTLTADAFRVVALKSNAKETAKAKKVDVLSVSFSVPAEMSLRGREEIYLSLTDAQGNAFKPALRTLTLSTSEEEIPVHASNVVDFNQKPESVTLTVYDTKDVKPGRYRASIYSRDKYLGSVELQFRDSFWFF